MKGDHRWIICFVVFICVAAIATWLNTMPRAIEERQYGSASDVSEVRYTYGWPLIAAELVTETTRAPGDVETRLSKDLRFHYGISLVGDCLIWILVICIAMIGVLILPYRSNVAT